MFLEHYEENAGYESVVKNPGDESTTWNESFSNPRIITLHDDKRSGIEYNMIEVGKRIEQ